MDDDSVPPSFPSGNAPVQHDGYRLITKRATSGFARAQSPLSHVIGFVGVLVWFGGMMGSIVLLRRVGVELSAAIWIAMAVFIVGPIFAAFIHKRWDSSKPTPAILVPEAIAFDEPFAVAIDAGGATIHSVDVACCVRTSYRDEKGRRRSTTKNLYSSPLDRLDPDDDTPPGLPTLAGVTFTGVIRSHLEPSSGRWFAAVYLGGEGRLGRYRRAYEIDVVPRKRRTPPA